MNKMGVIGGKAHIYMIWICEALQVGLRLNHDVTTSDRLVPTQKFLNPKLNGGIRLKVVPYTHLDVNMIGICEALQVGFEAKPC
jgi:hypothetical protein